RKRNITQYIASIWGNARMKMPTTLTPENNGWIRNDNEYIYDWYKGNTVPPSNHDALLQCDQSNEIESENDDVMDNYQCYSEDE
ncbi:hypothetical protein PV325_012788, partial [Microctonus aethiopoides]